MSELGSAIIMEAGPVKHWWNENWETKAHWDYVEWRDAVSQGLVDAEYLVYRPHEAFKGTWTERAQSVNDTALREADLVLNLTPPNVPSEGTHGEILLARDFGREKIMDAPPVENVEQGVSDLVKKIDDLDLRRIIVPQEKVLDSLVLHESRRWLLEAAVAHYCGHILRVHYIDESGRIEATDMTDMAIFGDTEAIIDMQTDDGQTLAMSIIRMLKVEILERRVN